MKRAPATITVADRAFTSVLGAEYSTIIITAITAAIMGATTATTNALDE
jgi:hypothetical protein